MVFCFSVNRKLQLTKIYVIWLIKLSEGVFMVLWAIQIATERFFREFIAS